MIFVDEMGTEAVALLEEELVKLSIRSAMIVPLEKPTLLCTVWSKKSYNLDSFRA